MGEWIKMITLIGYTKEKRMKNVLKLVSIIAIVAVIGFLMVSCGDLTDNGAGDPDGDGTGGTGNPKDNAKTITVGYSASHTISSSGEHWFKFVGTGNPVIFETRGNVVDTYMLFDDSGFFWGAEDDNSGEGSNALISRTPTSGTTYYIKITARNNTSGTYTFVVTAPTTNLRTNPITVAVGNSSSHIISSNGEHWFRFIGDGNRVFFETTGNVVNTNISIFIGDSTNSSFSRRTGDPGINFITVSGTIYHIRITGNSGTYTFNLRHGTGDANSRYNAEEVTIGYSGSHTITASGEHWFIYQGTGNPVTFKTTGNVVDTYMLFDDSGFFWGAEDDNSGEGANALIRRTPTSGTTYYIKITARSSTYGTYTFVVE